jgi:hypothetical protein
MVLMFIKAVINFLKKNWRGLLVFFLAIAFFACTAGFNYVLHEPGFIKFDSPDGAANYTFSKLYSQTGELVIFEKYNLLAEDIIHPRSVKSELGTLKPVSFLGIILIFGKIASFTSYRIIPFLTPLFASIAVIFFYLGVKSIFRERNALISTFLLVSFPPFIYYTARSMFHNVLFVSFLLAGLYFSYVMATGNKKRPRFFSLSLSHISGKAWVAAILAGLLIGLAVSVRTSELLWLLPSLSVLWLFNIRKVGMVKLVLFLASVFIGLLPAMYWNQVLYNNPFYGGYPEMNQSLSSLQATGEDMVKTTVMGNLEMIPDLALKVKDTLFYFGFNPDLVHKMFYHYLISMFPWLFWFGIFGAFIFFQGWGRWKRKHWAYIFAYLLASAILIYYYGSWRFHDNPNEASHTIGNSYTRYWLPVYLGALPFVSIFISKVSEYLFPVEKIEKKTRSNKKKEPGSSFVSPGGRSLKIRKILIVSASSLMIIGIFYTGLVFTFTCPEEGLLRTRENKESSRRQFQEILSSTESDSVVITRYHDKLLFPERKVVVGLFQDDNMIRNYYKMTGVMPVYYYNFTLPQESLDYLNNRRLQEFNLRIRKIKDITADFSLYKLSRQD